MTRFITVQEFETMKLYELDNFTYKQIEKAFIKACGEKIAKKLLNKWIEKKLHEITCNSYVNVMAYINIIG